MQKTINYAGREETNYHTDYSSSMDRSKLVEKMWYYDGHFLDPELCDELVNEVRKQNPTFQKGTGTHIPDSWDKSYRDSDITFLSDMENNIYRETRDLVVAKTLSINGAIFNFDLTHLMHIQYTQYNDKNQHFIWHADGPIGVQAAPDVEIPTSLIFRKLSTVICLADHEDYEGGEFMMLDGSVVPEYAVCQFKMTKGEAIVFPAFVLHRVMPVTKGLRTSLVNWFCGPRWT